MPTREEIIESFKISASKETWVKNPPHDPQTYQTSLEEAVAHLEAVLDDNNVNTCSPKAVALMELQKGSPSVGVATCQALFTHGDPGKAMALDVAKQVMSLEVGRFNPTQGFIRGQHAINGLSKQFIQDTSPDYKRDLETKVGEIANKYGDRMERALNGNDWNEKTKVTSEVGKEIVGVMASTPLSQESVDFLREMRESIESNQQYDNNYRLQFPNATQEEINNAKQTVADIVVNNNSALRFAGPTLQNNQRLQNNQLWKDASGAALSTFSGARKDELKPKVKADPNQMVEGKPIVLTKQDIAENKHLADISKNIHEVRGMVLEAQEHIANGEVAVNKTVEKFHHDNAQRQDKATVQPDLDKLANLQAKLEKLETKKPSLGTKFKALFKKDGIEGMKADLRVKIEKTKLDIAGKVDEGQFGARMDMHRDNLRDARRQHQDNVIGAHDYLQAKQEVNRLGSNQGINAVDMHTSTQEHAQVNQGLEENLQKMEENRPSYEAFNQAGGKISETMKILDHGNKNAVNKPSVGELLRKDHVGGDQTEHKEQVHVGHGTK